MFMAAASLNPPNRQDNDIHSRVVLTEQNLSTLSQTMERFISAQQAENNRLYDAISKQGDHTATGLNEVKDALNSRGRITGQTVFGVIAIILSLITMIGGFVHFYVQNQIGLTKGDVAQVAQTVLAVKADNDRINEKQWDVLQRMQEKREEEMKDEVHRLRDFRDKMAVAPVAPIAPIAPIAPVAPLVPNH